MIKTIKRFFDFNISPIVDRYWPKIETAMNQAQRYFSGLESNIYTVNNGSVYIIYFTRNGKIINDEFNTYKMNYIPTLFGMIVMVLVMVRH